MKTQMLSEKPTAQFGSLYSVVSTFSMAKWSFEIRSFNG